MSTWQKYINILNHLKHLKSLLKQQPDILGGDFCIKPFFAVVLKRFKMKRYCFAATEKMEKYLFGSHKNVSIPSEWITLCSALFCFEPTSHFVDVFGFHFSKNIHIS